MKISLLGILILFCAGVPGAFAQSRSIFDKPQSGGDKKELLGEWEGAVVEGDGSNQGQRRMNIHLSITDGKITAGGGGGQGGPGGNMMGEGTYRISGGGGKMKHIDATGTAGQYQGKIYQGVFSVEGDTLKWCSGNPGKGRPSSLRTNTGAGHFLMVLTRQK